MDHHHAGRAGRGAARPGAEHRALGDVLVFLDRGPCGLRWTGPRQCIRMPAAAQAHPLPCAGLSTGEMACTRKAPTDDSDPTEMLPARVRAGAAAPGRSPASPARACRPLPHRIAAGPRRHGRGLPRRAAGAGAPHGGAEAAAAAAPGCAAPGLFRSRAADAGADAAPGHRPDLRRRRDRGRFPVLRHGVHRRHAADAFLRRTRAAAAPAYRTIHPHLPGRAACAPQGRDPSRSEAGQYSGGRSGRQAAAENHRLRHRHRRLARAGRRVGRARGHARLHEPGAGRRRSIGGGYAQRRVFAWRAAVRIAGRQSPARRPRNAHGRRKHAASSLGTAGHAAARAGRTAGAHAGP